MQCRENIQQGSNQDPLSCCFFSHREISSFNNIHTFCWCITSKAADLIYVLLASMYPFNQIYKPHFPKPQILIPAWNVCGGTWCIELIFVFSLSFLPSAFSLYRHSVCCEWKQSEPDREREREWNKAFGRWVILKLNCLIRVQHGGWEWRADSILESAVAMKITFQGPWLNWSSALKASHL